MASPPEEGGLEEVWDADNKTIISYSTLCNIIPPQLKKMPEYYTAMYVGVGVSQLPKICTFPC